MLKQEQKGWQVLTLFLLISPLFLFLKFFFVPHTCCERQHPQLLSLHSFTRTNSASGTHHNRGRHTSASTTQCVQSILAQECSPEEQSGTTRGKTIHEWPKKRRRGESLPDLHSLTQKKSQPSSCVSVFKYSTCLASFGIRRARVCLSVLHFGSPWVAEGRWHCVSDLSSSVLVFFFSLSLSLAHPLLPLSVSRL